MDCILRLMLSTAPNSLFSCVRTQRRSAPATSGSPSPSPSPTTTYPSAAPATFRSSPSAPRASAGRGPGRCPDPRLPRRRRLRLPRRPRPPLLDRHPRGFPSSTSGSILHVQDLFLRPSWPCCPLTPHDGCLRGRSFRVDAIGTSTFARSTPPTMRIPNAIAGEQTDTATGISHPPSSRNVTSSQIATPRSTALPKSSSPRTTPPRPQGQEAKSCLRPLLVAHDN